ncbi:putative RNA-directed DNA polymerase from transposon X-element [Trichonephila clavipes]|nr:putative RNA-directed DNA polymerase from transposon X-element [Trichonephila clavipes]
MQDQDVPQGSVLSVTLFDIHMSDILHKLPPSVRGMLYIDDLQNSCQGSDTRLIERQLQTTVNRLVKWCDQNGHTISPSKSSCVHFCRKRNLHPDPSIHIGNIQIPVASEVRFLGVIFDSKLTFHPHVLYLRKKCELSLNILKVLSNTLWGADKVSLLQVYQALILSRLDYGCVVYGSARASVLKRLDTVHHSALRICSLVPSELRLLPACMCKYSKYIPVYTDGSKTAGHVGCDVVFNNTILSFTLHNSMSAFSAELTALLVALQHILISNHRHFRVYTDSTSALESLHFLTEHRHPTVTEILLLLRKLERKGFDIIFSWVPGHVGILGNEQADTAARSVSDPMQQPVCYRDLKTSIQNYVPHIWQETWDEQILNKLHSTHPSTSHWAAVRRHDVRLTRLRIGHTRFTHRPLLLGENTPECPSCKVPYSVYHILIDCLVFNHHRITFFHTSVLTLYDLVGESPHQNLFSFLLKIGFLHMI